MYELTISVTQEDIDNGCRRVGNSCPIARAFQRYLPNMIAEVGAAATYLRQPYAPMHEDGFRMVNCPNAEMFVIHFDDGLKPVEPCEVSFVF
jgi:hypothetical protein